MLLPLHNPVDIAEQAALLDVMTGGRFTLGVGLGYRPEEFQAFQVPLKQRVSHMQESIDIIRRLWAEDDVTHHGRHFQFDNLSIHPKPARPGGPPILIGAQVDVSVARAARIADGWLAVPLPTTGELATHTELFHRSRAEAGLSPSSNVVRLL